jgi:hypothetical protein
MSTPGAVRSSACAAGCFGVSVSQVLAQVLRPPHVLGVHDRDHHA